MASAIDYRGTKETVTGDKCNECVIGLYGANCDKSCPENCLHSKCGKENGHCQDGCNVSFNGITCEDCTKTKHGKDCKLDCPRTCANNECEKMSGRCFGCIDNYDGDTCSQCKSGWYGSGCDKKCSLYCFNDTCGKDNGICVYGCKKTYYGDKCCVNNENCLYCSSNTKCRECKSGYFQDRCEEKCSVNCLGPCDFFTGICHACVQNRQGSFCNRTCPESCNPSRDSYTSQCLSVDGRCAFGCKEGFFGLTCNETCSSLCIGDACMQEGGFCKYGCTGTNKDPICALSSEGTQEVSKYNSSTTIIAVLATLLAVTITALCILMLKKIVTKMRFNVRHTKDTSQQVHFDNALVGTQNADVTIVSNLDVNYETLERNQREPEHTYDAANLNATESTDNDGNTQYMNL